MKTILLVCHDRGGANLLAALLQQSDWLRQQTLQLWAEGPALPAFCNVQLSLLKVKQLTQNQSDKPDLVICATSFHAVLEREVVRKAKQLGIPTMSVIDSWMNLASRFWHPVRRCYDFPDLIGVIDAPSAGKLLEALGENTPPLAIVGQPYLQGLLQQQQAKTAATTQQFDFLYCSEPMQQSYNQHGELGYDQYSVFNDIVQLFEQKHQRIELVVKPHPAESIDDWQHYLQKFASLKWVRCRLCCEPLQDLFAAANVVVGMVSMALLEAVLADKPVFSCQFNRRFALADEITRYMHICNEPAQLWQALQQPAQRTQPTSLVNILYQSSQRLELWLQYLLGAPLQLRMAVPDDCQRYFHWVNDPVVRSMSFQTELVQWHEHQQWFQHKLENPQALLMVAEQHGKAIGQIRFDIEGSSCWLDYSLSTAVRGQGLAPLMLQLGCQRVFQTTTCRQIKAQVKLLNTASCRALLAAGFLTQSQSDAWLQFELSLD